MITQDTLLEWGFKRAGWLEDAVREANEAANAGMSEADIRELLSAMQPSPAEMQPMRTNSLPLSDFLEDSVENETERENHRAVIEHMDILMRTPVVTAAAVMPDACPSDRAPGTIPIGGVVASRAIHPGMHSADICCSVAVSIFKRREDAGKVLDAAQKVTHFGAGGRKDVDALHPKELHQLIGGFGANPFLQGLEDYAKFHFMTQGDGNHFLYVGELASTGEMAVVTHHGSRGFGGQLYKRGKAAAERHTAIHAPRVPAHNAWIEPESEQGENYWNALQVAREWTKLNHFAIHDALAAKLGIKVMGRFWNEHNFVFRKSDGLFYHAKGATPAYRGYAADASGQMLIPLNMSQPILIAAPTDSADPDAGIGGFAPHGAGRNMSRSAHAKRLAAEFGDDRGLGPNAIKAIVERETKGIDARFFTGVPDVSELPSAYKNADQVTAAIERHNLARIADTIRPLGSMMAGEMNWNRRR